MRKRNGYMAGIGILMGFILLVAGCRQDPVDPVQYKNDLEQWRAQRLNRLKEKNGWLSLAGLYWLQEGMNTFGSDSSNTIVFPVKAPAFIGTLELRNDTVFLRSLLQPVLADSLPARPMKLSDDASGKPTLMSLHPFTWSIIRRGERFGLRLRDYESAARNSLDSIPHYGTDMRYRVKARFKPYAKPEKIRVQTIIGTEEESLIPGELHFRLSGKKQVLYPFAEEGRLFLVFGDQSNGEETYPAGRFLYADAPDKDNNVILDFNMAYNPPCAFTPYATCPLPVSKNILPVPVPVGEKAVHRVPGH